MGCVSWNIEQINEFKEDTKPHWTFVYFAPWGPFIGLDQNWGMFAPRPPDADFWYVIEAQLADNSTVSNVLTHKKNLNLASHTN